MKRSIQRQLHKTGSDGANQSYFRYESNKQQLEFFIFVFTT